jgi:hypothetical protein
MDKQTGAETPTGVREGDLKDLVRQILNEVREAERAVREPAYKVEVAEERKRREALENRVRELEQEKLLSQRRAEEAERSAQVRAELQRLGVSKVDLAYRVLKDEIMRSETGELKARTPQGEVGLRSYLEGFVTENPEFLPPRIGGGAGSKAAETEAAGGGRESVSVADIRPGMSQEELRKAREEIARLANQALRGA